MNNEQAQKKYKRNEKYNLHSENLLLLAKLFGTEEEQNLAERNLSERDRLGYIDFELNNETKEKISPYYKKLFPVVKKQEQEKKMKPILDWSYTVEQIEKLLPTYTIFDRMEISGITKERVKARIKHLRETQVPNRTVLLEMDNEKLLFAWLKNWIHPALKDIVLKSPASKLGCSKEVLERDSKRDMLAFYQNGQQNFNYTLEEIEEWANS